MCTFMMAGGHTLEVVGREVCKPYTPPLLRVACAFAHTANSVTRFTRERERVPWAFGVL